MLKDLSPKKTFGLMLIAVYIVSLPILSSLTYVILKNQAVRTAYNVGRVRLVSMEAVKTFVDEELRPILYRELPGRFIVEGMSRSYVAGAIARRVQKEYPGYVYKNASTAPKNIGNSADDFEAKIISSFIKDRTVKEWSGFRTRSDGEYYVIAKAGEAFTERCLPLSR